MSFWNREPKPRQGGAEMPMADLFRLDKRTVAITGASGSLGLAIARAVVESGGDVILLDTREAQDDHREWLSALATQNQAKISFQACDVTDENSIKKAFKAGMSSMVHPLRGLVCCAGISGIGPSVEWSVEEWQRIHAINSLGTFICAREAARQMRTQDVTAGSIVFIASMSGHGANKGCDSTAYNASKAAVQQTARSLANEWGSNKDMPLIRVNSVSPGYILSRLTVDILKEPAMKKQWEEDNMLMRISHADEYRGPVVFLLSDASSFMTGADLRVDGGHTAW